MTDSIKRRQTIIHAAVIEFLSAVSFEKTLSAYNIELHDNEISPDLAALPLSNDEDSMKLKESMLQAFNDGNHDAFFKLWNDNIPESTRKEAETERIQFLSKVYFAVYPLASKAEIQSSSSEVSMKQFKAFLETEGAALSQTTEFVAYYALPFVPSPRDHPSFRLVFEDPWRQDLRSKLEKFLSSVFLCEPVPYLYRLFIGADRQTMKEKHEHRLQVDLLKRQVTEQELRATTYFKKFAKLQGDYYNLIGIAAELVDSLENAVRGKMVTAEYLQSICSRLFASSGTQESLDLTRPGTTGSLLRASVSNISLTGQPANSSKLAALNFPKIKEDLKGKAPREQALLLQALKWRLTKSRAGEQRDGVIFSFISNDILGCSNDALFRKTALSLIEADDDVVQENMARFVNALTSFSTGRAYIAQCQPVVSSMLAALKKASVGSLVSENLLGSLQKLSLRRSVQTLMIDSDVIVWLFSLLEEPDLLSDYAVEYTAALLMNLCLRLAGKLKCRAKAKKILKLLTDLLGCDNHEIRPYVNGTLYSILAVPSIRKTAIDMGLDEVLKCYVHDDTPDMNRQIQFIVKQIGNAEPDNDDDLQSDDEEEEDEDDEEGDAIDAEIEKEESLFALPDELEGERLLVSKYLVETARKERQKIEKAKMKTFNQSPELLTRPVTPGAKSHKVSSLTASERSSSSPVAPQRVVSQERPRTSSSRSGRGRPPAEQAPSDQAVRNQAVLQKKGNRNAKEAFSSRPKIPRTPDVANQSPTREVLRSPPADALLPTRSVSPPRPSTGDRRRGPFADVSERHLKT